jgi:NAD+ kinase
VIGGDGTMLNAARRLARYRVPLVGVNQGRLGFMTDIARADMLTCMEDLLDGRFVSENRMLLDAEVMRDGQELAANLASTMSSIDKGAIGRMIEFELFIDGEFIYNLRADGLIVSTPTGFDRLCTVGQWPDPASDRFPESRWFPCVRMR